MEKFLDECINTEIDNYEKEEYKTFLLFLKNTRDPIIYDKLSHNDLMINGILLLYPI
jgi:hypothetical protein